MSATTELRCTTTGCGHCLADHEALAPQCSAPRCTCLKWRRPVESASPAAVAVAPIPSGLSTPAVRRAISTPPAAPATVPGAAPAAPNGLFTVEELVRACRRSESKRTQALGPKLTELADRITAALRGEREAAEAKAKQAEEFTARKAQVDRLTKQLADAKAALSGLKPPPGDTEASLSFACSECGDRFTTSQGRSLHGRRKHVGGAA